VTAGKTVVMGARAASPAKLGVAGPMWRDVRPTTSIRTTGFMKGADASIDLMLDRIANLFRGRPAIVHGTQKLPEGHAKRVELGDILAGGKSVILCRVDGKLFALDTRCPHDGGRIVDGPLVDGRFAICPLHNYTFDPKDGRVERGSCPKATAYRVREKNGDAEIWT